MTIPQADEKSVALYVAKLVQKADAFQLARKQAGLEEEQDAAAKRAKAERDKNHSPRPKDDKGDGWGPYTPGLDRRARAWPLHWTAMPGLGFKSTRDLLR